jgi:hypothetical protein
MAHTEDHAHRDAALEALTTLSEVASASVAELNVVGDELTMMKQRRRRGWSWRKILSSVGVRPPAFGGACVRALEDLKAPKPLRPSNLGRRRSR